MMKRDKSPLKQALFLNSSGDYTITDNNGNTVTVDRAKTLYEAGALDDWNLAFQRLANNGFDIESTRKQYADMNASARKA